MSDPAYMANFRYQVIEILAPLTVLGFKDINGLQAEAKQALEAITAEARLLLEYQGLDQKTAEMLLSKRVMERKVD